MKLATLFELGRVSNLPTVWSNVLAATALALTAQDSLGWSGLVVPLGCCLVTGTLLYEGGMLLNDAYDAEVDRVERPERAIPSGRASRREVTVWGFSLLGLGVLIPALFARLELVAVGAMPAALFIAGCVVAYDRFHKGYAWSPLLMGACRAGLYALGALAVSNELPSEFGVKMLVLLAYVVGLTHVARFETGTVVSRTWVLASLFAPALTQSLLGAESWVETLPFLVLQVAWVLTCLGFLRSRAKGNVGRAVVSLIAGISLVDASFAAAAGQLLVAMVAVTAFALTLALQRWVRGT